MLSKIKLENKAQISLELLVIIAAGLIITTTIALTIKKSIIAPTKVEAISTGQDINFKKT
ncbi:MAG: hypothetical protein COT15_00470 [Candidatus Diapherotrites archaeon CG08_land_8_20_14_0_20_34_12]|nr:MAG: hypothetical protein COT15_00470 [Candidatus Diapherotrites archaeon CG08_land_8_20_14_0_20_34_12]